MPGADEVNRRLLELTGRQKAAVSALSERYAAEMEAHAKPNAPWVDRTSMARKLLFGYVFSREAHLLIRIAHGVEYGKYLELANQQKNAILEPTAKQYAPKFFEDVKKLVGR